MNEYFTPLIEDIRVGYECEMNYPNSTGWTKFVVKDTWFGRDGEGDFPEVFSALTDYSYDKNKPIDKIRVPYLTKEQIEAEGWKHMWWEKGVHSWETTNHILTTFDGGYRIIIDAKGPRRLFDGECKDINTFRYIQNLLGIK